MTKWHGAGTSGNLVDTVGIMIVRSRQILVALGLALLLAGPALAASPQDQSECAAEDPARAVPACSRIIADAGESAQSRADAYVLRARAYLAQGNVARAVADCSEAIKLTPRNVAAYVRRALGYFRSDDRDHAILDYSIADKLDAAAVARMAAADPQIEELAAAARASPPSPAALALIVDQLSAAVQAPPPPVPAPPPPPAPRPVKPASPPPPPPKRWNSVAAAIWKVNGQAHVAIGYSGTRATQADAKAHAVEACRNAAGQDCQAKGAWNYGCVYITTGHATGKAGWGSGDSVAAALSKCQQQGLECKPPIGGCVQ
jgi:tetratricopeptide (TPR) repeat protein